MRGKRSVAEIQQSGILESAEFSDEPFDIPGIVRHEWFKRVINRLSSCDLVFADPDNGLYSDNRFNPNRKDNAKRIPVAEAKALAEGRTAVIYHHNNRAAKHLPQILDWMEQLPSCTHAYYWRRQSPRTFFVVNPDSEMKLRLEDFAKRWNGKRTNPNGKLVRTDDFHEGP